MHHGSEGERGDETAQEVLNTHAQDGHTWGSEHTRESSSKNTSECILSFPERGRKV